MPNVPQAAGAALQPQPEGLQDRLLHLNGDCSSPAPATHQYERPSVCARASASVHPHVGGHGSHVAGHGRAARRSSDPRAFLAPQSPQDITNSIFLLAAFLCLQFDFSPEEAWQPFAGLDAGLSLPYRDATWAKSTFDLHIKDCLAGLQRGVSRGFLRFQEFDVEEYFYYDYPLNGDMHEVVPKKFIAFRGPSGDSESDCGLRAADFLDVFADKNVSTVVRLNSGQYKASTFRKAGFEHVSLIYTDCSVPCDSIVDRFLRVAETAQGVVAVHCLAGLGRTGTLIGLYLMKHHRFTAREAIAWLRICRPGSVIGPQQEYLVQQEARMHRLGAQGLPGLSHELEAVGETSFSPGTVERKRHMTSIIDTYQDTKKPPPDSPHTCAQQSFVLSQMITLGMMHRQNVRSGRALKHTHSASELLSPENGLFDRPSSSELKDGYIEEMTPPPTPRGGLQDSSVRAAAEDNASSGSQMKWASFSRTHYPRQFFDFINGAHTSRIRPRKARKSTTQQVWHKRLASVQASNLGNDRKKAVDSNSSSRAISPTESELSAASSVPSSPVRVQGNCTDSGTAANFGDNQEMKGGALCDSKWNHYARSHFPRQFMRQFDRCGQSDSGASPCLLLNRSDRARAFSQNSGDTLSVRTGGATI